ncbi:unnamed protein product [Aspergillus oryzae]|nr:unnamed protein product [Aspergillus oryzae]
MHMLSFIGALALPVFVCAQSCEPASLSPRLAGVDLEKFRLTPNAEYVDSDQQIPISTTNVGLIEQSYVETAIKLVRETFPTASFRLREDHYVGDNGVAHVHFRQTVHDLDVDNGDFNVNVCADILR